MLPTPPPERSNPNLAAALAEAAERILPERIQQVWVFPPHTHAGRESGLAVLAVRSEDPGEARLVIHTVRYEEESAKDVVRRTVTLTEEGIVPRDRLDRLVDGIVRRLGGGVETPDVRELADGSETWIALLQELADGVDVRKQ